MTARPAPTPAFVSYEEYCVLEAQTQERHDYDQGRVVAMAGGSLNHSWIISNLIREVGNRLKGRPCGMLDSNSRIAFPRKTYSHYTDGTILCGPPDIDPRDPSGQGLTNPTVIIEVLSPSTADFDRGTKFDRYRELPSFREYVVVFQDRAEIQVFNKTDDGTWGMKTFAGLTADVPRRSVGITLPSAEIYDRVDFAQPASDSTEASAG